jgi:opacity protein-like surface antigen
MDLAMTGPTRTSGLSCLAFAAAVAATSISFSVPALAIEPPPLPVASWTGFYAGLHGGWGWGSTRVYDPVANAVYMPTETKYNGPLAGGQLGFNWQQGNFVLGAEVDASRAFVHRDTGTTGVFISTTTSNGFGYNSLVTGTARVGYTMGQWLAYAKGGVARADLEITTRFVATPTIYDRALIGAVGGAGFEVAFLRNVSAKVEYNYIWLPVDHLVYSSPNWVSDLEHRIHVVKFGVNVRLGPDMFR